MIKSQDNSEASKLPIPPPEAQHRNHIIDTDGLSSNNEAMIISLLFSLLLLSLDRFTKMLILTSSFSYPGRFLRIQLSKNPNLFFLPINSILITIIGLTIILVLFFTLIKAWRQKNILVVTSLLLIISGGLSNLYDRLIFNYVIDWLWIAILPISVFNLADVMITAGCTLLLVQLLRSQH